ncbi:hypothetical protein E8D34_17160 [Nocardioides sp. GY 10113]|nr:hypothetical protein E8D34_17160 [Nocardioides sp. GY 10113]
MVGSGGCDGEGPARQLLHVSAPAPVSTATRRDAARGVSTGRPPRPLAAVGGGPDFRPEGELFPRSPQANPTTGRKMRRDGPLRPKKRNAPGERGSPGAFSFGGGGGI